MTAWRSGVCCLVTWFLFVSTGIPAVAHPARQKSTKTDRRALTLAIQMIEAIHSGDLDQVKRYLKRGVPINAPVYLPESKQTLTPLVDAAIHGDPRLVEYLLRHGADANGPTSRDPKGYYFDGFTALLAAASSGNSESVRLLLKAGAKLSVRNRQGKNAIDEAIDGPGGSFSESRMDAVKLLYQAGVRITKPDEHLQHLFANDPNTTSDICGFLLEHGANANSRFHFQGYPDTGITLLMYGCGADPWWTAGIPQDRPIYGRCSVTGTQLLLAHGANPNLKDNEGRTALWYAMELQKRYTGRGNYDDPMHTFREISAIIAILKAVGAK